MLQTIFKKGKQYFHLRNYKNQSVFHIAARHNSLDAIQTLVGKRWFFDELLVRDWKGDTPIHTASKNGSIETLEFYLQNSTHRFADIENDFGSTPLEAVRTKIKFCELGEVELIRDDGQELKEDDKLANLRRCENLLETFEDWLDRENWPYEVSYEDFCRKAEPDLKVFMGLHANMIHDMVVQEMIKK